MQNVWHMMFLLPYTVYHNKRCPLYRERHPDWERRASHHGPSAGPHVEQQHPGRVHRAPHHPQPVIWVSMLFCAAVYTIPVISWRTVKSTNFPSYEKSISRHLWKYLTVQVKVLKSHAPQSASRTNWLGRGLKLPPQRPVTNVFIGCYVDLDAECIYYIIYLLMLSSYSSVWSFSVVFDC